MTDAAAKQSISMTNDDDDDTDSIEIAITDNVVATILIEDPSWYQLLNKIENRQLSHVMEQAIKGYDVVSSLDFTIMLTDDSRMTALNQEFRQKATPTNVLSFPDDSDVHYLGDIAIGYGFMSREAYAEGKQEKDHFIHLLIHGVLHLLGFDHVNEDQAHVMETMETRILSAIGIADPYLLVDEV